MHPPVAPYKFLVPVIVPKARSNAFIELGDRIVSAIVTSDGAKTHRQQRSDKTSIRLEESKLNTTNWQPGPVQG